MQKNILKKYSKLTVICLSVSVLSFVIAMGIRIVFADWQAPSGAPPSGDISAPINVSSADQEKTGGLDIMGNVGIGANTFLDGTQLNIRDSMYVKDGGWVSISVDGTPNYDFRGLTVGGSGAQGNVAVVGGGHFIMRESGGRFDFYLNPDKYAVFQTEASSNSEGFIFEPREAEKMRITTDGDVGIGTDNPGAKLDVDGPIRMQWPSSQGNGTYDEWFAGYGGVTQYNSNRELRLQELYAGGGLYQYLLYNGRVSGGVYPPTFWQGNYGRFSGIEFYHDATHFLVNTGDAGGGSNTEITPTKALTIKYTGNVGIGTDDPGYPLDVNGDINGTRLCIAGDCQSSWPTGGTQTLAEVYREGGNEVQMTAGDGDVRFYNDGGDEIVFLDESKGSVGIGTTNTRDANLYVDGTIRLPNANQGDGIWRGIQVGVGYGAFNFQGSYDVHASILIGHNAYGVDGSTYWRQDHATFGSRMIKFRYGSGDDKGIIFYADAVQTFTNQSFTPTPRMIITNDGRVGIGTIGPLSKLEVTGDDQYTIRSYNTSSNINVAAVKGTANSDSVEGYLAYRAGASSEYGVFGQGLGLTPNSSHGVGGSSIEGYGVYGFSNDSYGVYGKSTDNYGVFGQSSNDVGIYGDGATYGVVGYTNSLYAGVAGHNLESSEDSLSAGVYGASGDA